MGARLLSVAACGTAGAVLVCSAHRDGAISEKPGSAGGSSADTARGNASVTGGITAPPASSSSEADGRAAGVLEAVLWHEGEAEVTRRRVMKLSTANRGALVAFVMSL